MTQFTVNQFSALFERRRLRKREIMESSRDFVEKRFTVFIQPLKVDGQIQGIHKIVEDG